MESASQVIRGKETPIGTRVQGEGWLPRLRRLFFVEVDGASLAFFRICFGFIMFLEVCRYFAFGWISNYYIEPQYYFSFFPFIKPWPGNGMYWHFGLLGVTSLMIMFGLFYRAAAVLFCAGFTYVFLLDKTQYLNHFYLICLFSFFLIWMPAHRCWSLDRLRLGAKLPSSVPHWTLLLLRFQIVLVYFYAGVAKLNEDWLRGEPQRSWLAERANDGTFASWLNQEWVVWLLTYGGLAVDLSVGFLLLSRRTFWLGAAFVVLFNLSNAFLFSIGIFPFMMLATLGLFLPSDWPRQALDRWKAGFLNAGSKKNAKRSNVPSRFDDSAKSSKLELSFSQRALTSAILIYCFLQIVIPLRHWLYPSSVHWTEEGHRFSWHMKLRDKFATATLYLEDPRRKQLERIPLENLLTKRQISKMSSRPDMIHQLAIDLAKDYEQKNGVRPKVFAHVMASLNGRPYQTLIDPAVDLASQPKSLFSKPWILPLADRPMTAERAIF